MRKIAKSHLKLYERMRERHENKEQFTRKDLLEIYINFVKPAKDNYSYQERTTEVIRANSLTWLNTAICALIRRGYLGLTFRKNIISQKIEGGIR